MELESAIKYIFKKTLAILNDLKDILELLRTNWRHNSSYTLDMIALPMSFINEYIGTLEMLLNKQLFTLKSVEGVNQRIGNFTRNFDNPFFQTSERDNINRLIDQLMDCRRELDELEEKLSSQ
jgi:hypothetical protein